MTDPSGFFWLDEMVAARNSFANSGTFQDYLGVETASAAEDYISLEAPEDPASDEDVFPLVIGPGELLSGSTTADGNGTVTDTSGQVIAILALYPPTGGSIDHGNPAAVRNWFFEKLSDIMAEVFDNQSNRDIGGLIVASWNATYGIAPDQDYEIEGKRYAFAIIEMNYGRGQ